MSNETHDTSTDLDSESMRATRRSALRGVGVAGLLGMGVGSTNASQDSGFLGLNAQQTRQQTNENNDAVPVTWDNYTRAESDTYFQSYVDLGGFGEFYHHRNLIPIDEQNVIQMNRDTLYSAGVFDLTEPVTITKPDTGDRYQLMIVINQDHYVTESSTTSGEFTLTQDAIGTRYCMVVFRTFLDPEDPDDVQEARRAQDEIAAKQDASVTTFEIPDWDQQSLKQIRDALITVGETMDNTRNTYGEADEVNPIKHLLGTAIAWGGMPESDTLFLWRTPEQNDGDTPYTLTVDDVPVDGFWSVTVYNRNWYLEANKYDAYSINNVTAERADDGSVTIHFGGDPDQLNFLYTPEGWSYTIRLYDPREAILNGSYQFPKAQLVE
ncbi:DUF1214 domain-containing protein [Halomicrococcus sp. SG-WS-1]|uniref:DUF1214 domain-containing protein n=1 Tax=Halomicrococcus sp. SG-WS-1 TaxID=3439057 RepID=UPI003F79C85C